MRRAATRTVVYLIERAIKRERGPAHAALNDNGPNSTTRKMTTLRTIVPRREV
jgi:hypothetical protein